MISVSFFKRYLPWIILMIKTQNFEILEQKITNNKYVSDYKKRSPVTPSITHSKNRNNTSSIQLVSNSTIQSDPNIPLFKALKYESVFCVIPLFNVLFRLENTFIKYIKTFKEKHNPLEDFLLDLYEKLNTKEVNQISLNYSVLLNLLEIIRKNYSISRLLDHLFIFLKAFLSQMVDYSDFDQENNYFTIKINHNYKRPENRKLQLFDVSYKKKIPLSLFNYKVLKNNLIDKNYMSLDCELDNIIINRPMLMFFYWPDKQKLNEEIKRHLILKRHSNGDIYNLKGIVYRNKENRFNSFFIQNNCFYDQESGSKHYITTVDIEDPNLLIYQLQESD
ncbi:hypothetical protein M153_5550004469 [Pseudoloma neurophilia]|uniref:Uncharacterized protein n=1 Tax=Pseudoloma neurophilia TaxID=146866 RepID=A0A0R0LWV0_9MICR|nr:hypothetical protein M153_5550004469 [Pseudoloma neurophilia]